MTEKHLNKKIPKFSLPATNGVTVTDKDFLGKNTVLYFYPKDDTPGCTLEGCAFRDQFEKFKRENTQIFGISRNSLESHEKFKAKYEMPFELISDPDEVLCKALEVLKEKSMFGKTSMGIERSTFLIDETGTIRQVWRDVSVGGHIDQVLSAIKSLK